MIPQVVLRRLEMQRVLFIILEARQDGEERTKNCSVAFVLVQWWSYAKRLACTGAHLIPGMFHCMVFSGYVFHIHMFLQACALLSSKLVLRSGMIMSAWCQVSTQTPFKGHIRFYSINNNAEVLHASLKTV